MKTHPHNYENKSLCALCKGSCCKALPGQYAPSDFKEPITYEFAKGLLLGGKHAIDWFEDDNDILYLRPRTIHGGMIDPSWGGRCIHHDLETGCELTDDVRPLQCRMLKPGGVIGSLKCTSPSEFNKENMAKMWLEHQTILKELRRELYED